MSMQSAREHLARFGAEGRIRVFDSSSATVALAAELMGCEPGRIAKTLSFKAGDGAMLVVVSGDMRVDNAKFKARFGARPHMLPGDAVEALVGHAVGGVCPFAVNEGVPVYLDESIRRYDTVCPGCGSEQSLVELTVDELERFSGYEAWVDVCRECGA